MLYHLNTYFNTCSPHCCPRHQPGLSDRQCSFKTQKHIDFHSGYSCLLSDLYSKPLSVVPCSGFFPTERNKAGAHCTTFGVRKEEGLLLWKKEKKRKASPIGPQEDTLEVHLLLCPNQLAGKMEGEIGGENIVQVGHLSLMRLWKILW